MQDDSAKMLDELYLGPAFHPERPGTEYWKLHQNDFKNGALIVHPHPNHRINIDIELRNRGDHDVGHVSIHLYVAEVNLSKLSVEQANALLRNVIKNNESIESWSNQVVPHHSSHPERVWRIPGGPVQAKLHETSYDYHYVVVARVELDNLSFFDSVRDPEFEVARQPLAAVWSSTLPMASPQAGASSPQ